MPAPTPAAASVELPVTGSGGAVGLTVGLAVGVVGFAVGVVGFAVGVVGFAVGVVGFAVGVVGFAVGVVGFAVGVVAVDAEALSSAVAGDVASANPRTANNAAVIAAENERSKTTSKSLRSFHTSMCCTRTG
jgi:hypothetical protein